jgi:hypothetical protein
MPDEYVLVAREAELSFMRTYATLTGTTEALLRTAIAPYVTVMAVTRMTEDSCSNAERAMLTGFVQSR